MAAPRMVIATASSPGDLHPFIAIGLALRARGAETVLAGPEDLLAKVRAAGLTSSNTYDLPTTQEQLGDATGLTSVHVNRTMQHLRRSGLISCSKQSITIEDWAGLTLAGGFDPAYLHHEAAAAH